ncbi:hypothetical protein [Microbulbifer sp.]|uniref:TlpA family protein disulfide reductase n=1 Tax=Microbulbifer sp. TaxID=1908541 RepID=UPI003F36DE3F
MYYLKWLVLAVSIALSACSGELDKRELRLKADFSEDFDRGLPEFLVFNPEGECVYHSLGFSTEEHFLEELDVVLAGGRIERSPVDSPEKRRLLELAVRKAVYENTSIPPEQKESTIRTSLRESMNPEPSCTHELEYYLGRFEEPDGGDFSLESLPGGKSVFIEFYADRCLPCKRQERALERYSPKGGNEFVLLKVERDKTKLQVQ